MKPSAPLLEEFLNVPGACLISPHLGLAPAQDGCGAGQDGCLGPVGGLWLFAPCGFQKGWDHTCSRFVMEGSLGHTAKTLRRLAEVEAGKTCLLVSSHSFLGALPTLGLVPPWGG